MRERERERERERVAKFEGFFLVKDPSGRSRYDYSGLKFIFLLRRRLLFFRLSHETKLSSNNFRSRIKVFN